MNESARIHAAAAAGDVHDPEARLQLPIEMAGRVDADRPHRWLPVPLGHTVRDFCDSTEDAAIHSGSGLTVEQLGQPFARAISAKSALLQAPLDGRQRAAVLSSLSADIRKYCDAASPRFLVPRVSTGALAEAQRRGVDLCQQVWQTQTTFDRDRSVFHLEHVIPVVSVRAACLAADAEENILETLLSIRIAWVLKVEDRALTRLGFRSRRQDPVAAYAEAAITLVDCCRRPPVP